VPAAAPAEDRAVPEFQVIPPTTLTFRLLLLIPLLLVTAGSMGAAFLIWRQTAALHIESPRLQFLIVTLAVLPPLVLAFLQSLVWRHALTLDRRLRFRPLVQTGKVLYAGTAGLKQPGIRYQSGYLFLTRDSIHFEPRTFGQAEQPMVRIPFADIDRISRHYQFFDRIPAAALRLSLPFGEHRLWLSQLKRWRTILDQLKDEAAESDFTPP